MLFGIYEASPRVGTNEETGARESSGAIDNAPIVDISGSPAVELRVQPRV